MTQTQHQLIDHFEQYLPLDEAEKAALLERVAERKIRRRQFVLQEGDVCRHYHFVVEGCFKMYQVDKKGTEHNLQFAAQNEWITDLGSFHSESPSHLFIEAVEACQVFSLAHKDLIFLYEHFPTFNRNFRVMIEDKYVELQNRVLQNISSTAVERYVAFLDQYRALSHRLPNTQIASYLGITPEFLSKIRKDLASGQIDA
jgi:CRP-like cAMP-binding protein